MDTESLLAREMELVRWDTPGTQGHRKVKIGDLTVHLGKYLQWSRITISRDGKDIFERKNPRAHPTDRDFWSISCLELVRVIEGLQDSKDSSAGEGE